MPILYYNSSYKKGENNMDDKLLKHAQEYIEKMANGINPLNNEKIKEDELINNVRISRCLFYVNTILKEVIANNKTKTKPFYLTKEQLSKYEYTNFPISITQILKKINALITDSAMSKLKINELINWLLEVGLIKIVEKNEKQVKVPTEFGRNLGLHIEHISTPSKEYDKIMYSKEAEEYIIANFTNLLTFINKKIKS